MGLGEGGAVDVVVTAPKGRRSSGISGELGYQEHPQPNNHTPNKSPTRTPTLPQTQLLFSLSYYPYSLPLTFTCSSPIAATCLPCSPPPLPDPHTPVARLPHTTYASYATTSTNAPLLLSERPDPGQTPTFCTTPPSHQSATTPRLCASCTRIRGNAGGASPHRSAPILTPRLLPLRSWHRWTWSRWSPGADPAGLPGSRNRM